MKSKINKINLLHIALYYKMSVATVQQYKCNLYNSTNTKIKIIQQIV